MATDSESEAFDYTNEGHAAYLKWYADYQSRMRAKYGLRLQNTLATHTEIFTDGKRMMVVVANVDLAKAEGDG